MATRLHALGTALHTVEVTGSNPVPPTHKWLKRKNLRYLSDDSAT